MEIIQYTSDMQTSVTQFYNRLTADVPHCYPVKEEEFAVAIQGVTTGKADEKEGGIDSETAFVALTEGQYRHSFISASVKFGITRKGKRTLVLFGFLVTNVVRGALGKPCLKRRKPI